MFYLGIPDLTKLNFYGNFSLYYSITCNTIVVSGDFKSHKVGTGPYGLFDLYGSKSVGIGKTHDWNVMAIPFLSDFLYTIFYFIVGKTKN